MVQKSVAVGLKILINQKKICQDKSDGPNNVLIMYSSKFTKVKPIFHTNPTESITTEHESCFLQYCFLCNKILRLDKEVYMYKYVFFSFLFLLYHIFVMDDRIPIESKAC